jgi:hypothetical protein
LVLTGLILGQIAVLPNGAAKLSSRPPHAPDARIGAVKHRGNLRLVACDHHRDLDQRSLERI